MNLEQFTKPSALIAIGMVVASAAMLTRNSIAAAHHAAAPTQHVGTVVTELPPVVITGKRLTVAEKAQYQQLLKTSSATLI